MLNTRRKVIEAIGKKKGGEDNGVGHLGNIHDTVRDDGPRDKRGYGLGRDFADFFRSQGPGRSGA